MKKRFAYLTLAILVASVATPVYAQTNPPAAADTTIQPNDKNALLKAAKKALLVSKKALTGATSDYQGHRNAAITHVDAAVKEIDSAISAANARDGK